MWTSTSVLESRPLDLPYQGEHICFDIPLPYSAQLYALPLVLPILKNQILSTIYDRHYEIPTLTVEPLKCSIAARMLVSPSSTR